MVTWRWRGTKWESRVIWAVIFLAGAVYLGCWGRAGSDGRLANYLAFLSGRDGFGIACLWNNLAVRQFNGQVAFLQNESFRTGGYFRILDGKTFIRTDGLDLVIQSLDGAARTGARRIPGFSAFALDWEPVTETLAYWVSEHLQERHRLRVVALLPAQRLLCEVAGSPTDDRTAGPYPGNGLSTTWIGGADQLIYSDGRRLIRLKLPKCETQTLATGTNASADPTGRWLAYRNGERHVTLAAYDGKRLQTVWTDDRKGIGEPRWSPDSRFLVYGIIEDNLIARSRIVVRDVAAQREVTLAPFATEQFPTTSCNGGYDFVRLKGR